MRSYVFKFNKNNSIIYPANSTDEEYHSNSLIFRMRYGPCVKTNGTAHAKLGDVFDPPQGRPEIERDTELCGDDFPLSKEVEIYYIKEQYNMVPDCTNLSETNGTAHADVKNHSITPVLGKSEYQGINDRQSSEPFL